MISRILAFAGSKQAGKTTSSNFLHGYQLKANGIINNFGITDNGSLAVESIVTDSNGKETVSSGLLDINRNDEEFAEWAAYNMWPYIKNYSFAAPLKEFCVSMFNLPRKNVFGNNELKNETSPFKWQDMPGVMTNKSQSIKKDAKLLIENGSLMYHRQGNMTYREFLQFFGTNVCRKIYPEIWHKRLIKDIEYEQPLIAVVDDCRFVNEIKSIQKNGGKVIHLTRNPYDDNHNSENELESYNGFDCVIDNANLDIHETNIKIIEAIDSWGWLDKGFVPPKTEPPKTEKELVSGIHTIKK